MLTWHFLHTMTTFIMNNNVSTRLEYTWHMQVMQNHAEYNILGPSVLDSSSASVVRLNLTRARRPPFGSRFAFTKQVCIWSLELRVVEAAQTVIASSARWHIAEMKHGFSCLSNLLYDSSSGKLGEDRGVSPYVLVHHEFVDVCANFPLWVLSLLLQYS